MSDVTRVYGYSTYYKCKIDVVYSKEQRFMVVYFYENSNNATGTHMKAGSELTININQQIINSVIPMKVYNSKAGRILYG